MVAFVSVRNWFWSESFWLPANVTWHDLERNDQLFIPDARDLWIAFPMAVLVFCVRLLWERFVALPLGRLQKFKETPLSKPPPNEVLEKAFKVHGKILPGHKQLLGFAKHLDWTTHQVERWWRKRLMLGRPSQMQRFKETSWRFIYYLCAFWSGLYILWNKPWFWETKYFWQDYPRQHVPVDIRWYYMVELSFYLSLVLSLFRDVKRKDFKEMVVHHVATISLITLSWSNNMVRIGSIVLCIHDTVDYWMEGAKLAKYCKYNRLCDVMFIIFTLLWFITRIVIYPFRVIYSAMFEGHVVVGMFPMYFVFNVLLWILQVLHIIWFYMILRMFYRYLVLGKIEKDDRSDTEPETESDDGNGVGDNGVGGNGVGGNGFRPTSANHATTLANSIKAHGDGIDLRKNCVTR